MSNMSMSPLYRLTPFDAQHVAPVHELADLHAALLPASPIALLGRQFMERVYYQRLPRADLIFGTVAYVAGQPAGFIVATQDPSGFMRTALRQWWPLVVWVVGTSILRTPRLLGTVWEVLRVMAAKREQPRIEAEGELLSLGVLEAYRTPRFIRESGLRISADLVESAVIRLQERGVRTVRATVSADNTPTKFFYSGLGWTLDQPETPTGWNSPTVDFIWQM
jgi:ribosomal protein S18 acetylase RimI-like enzyme